MSEGANRIFLRKNPLVEKELLKRLKRGDTTIELAEYLKTTKWPGSIEPSSVSAFIQKTYPTENMQLLLDAGYTESEIKKMTPAKRTGLKDSIRTYRKVLIPHLKKYDGTIESLVVEGVRDNKDIDYQLKKFRKETEPKILKLLKKELGNPEFKPKIAQNQLNKLVESGGSGDIRIDRSLTSNLLREQTKPVNVALNWIGDNASKLKYGKAGGLELFIKDYETKFGKLGKDPIFTRGSEGDNIRTPLTNVNKIKSFSKEDAAEIFSFKKGFSEEEIFKAALAQNNKSVQKRLIDAFRLASQNRSYYADLGIGALLKDLGKNKTNILGEFKIADDVKMGGSQEYGGVGGGILRRSLNALNITPKQLSDYQFIRKPLTTLDEIINSLSRKDADGSYIRDKYGLTSKDAKFVQQNFQKIEAGRKSLNSWLKESEKILGKNLFRNTLGPVNFEHSIAKGLGSAYKYLPRDYLLRGQYTPEAFNLAKRDVFDKPLMNLMQKFTETGEGEQKIKNLIRDFNKATNDYAGDLVFEDGKLKMLTDKANINKYDAIVGNPNLSVQEYLNTSQLGRRLKQFAPTSKSGSIEKLIKGGENIAEQLYQNPQVLKAVKLNLINYAKDNTDNVCEVVFGIGKATGGVAGGGCAKQMEFAFDNAPEQTLNQISQTNSPKLKTFAQRALSLFPKLGTPGKIAAGAVAGAATIGALTYNRELGEFVNPLNDDKASQGTLTDWIKDNPVKTVAGTSIGFSAQEIPGTYKKARELGRGRTRSALGITGALKPVLTTFGTPAMTALFEVPFGAKRLEEGETMTEILTDPLGPALGLSFMEPLTRSAGVIRGGEAGIMGGIKRAFNPLDFSNLGKARPGLTSTILRMGLSPLAIRAISKLGPWGMAAGVGLGALSQYQKYQNQEGMIYNFFNKDE